MNTTEAEIMKTQMPAMPTFYLTEDNKNELQKLYDKIDDGKSWAEIQKSINSNKKLAADTRQRDIVIQNVVNYYQDSED